MGFLNELSGLSFLGKALVGTLMVSVVVTAIPVPITETAEYKGDPTAPPVTDERTTAEASTSPLTEAQTSPSIQSTQDQTSTSTPTPSTETSTSSVSTSTSSTQTSTMKMSSTMLSSGAELPTDSAPTDLTSTSDSPTTEESTSGNSSSSIPDNSESTMIDTTTGFGDGSPVTSTEEASGRNSKDHVNLFDWEDDTEFVGETYENEDEENWYDEWEEPIVDEESDLDKEFKIFKNKEADVISDSWWKFVEEDNHHLENEEEGLYDWNEWSSSESHEFLIGDLGKALKTPV